MAVKRGFMVWFRARRCRLVSPRDESRGTISSDFTLPKFKLFIIFCLDRERNRMIRVVSILVASLFPSI